MTDGLANTGPFPAATLRVVPLPLAGEEEPYSFVGIRTGRVR